MTLDRTVFPAPSRVVSSSPPLCDRDKMKPGFPDGQGCFGPPRDVLAAAGELRVTFCGVGVTCDARDMGSCGFSDLNVSILWLLQRHDPVHVDDAVRGWLVFCRAQHQPICWVVCSEMVHAFLFYRARNLVCSM